jgi:hypothetical protein
LSAAAGAQNWAEAGDADGLASQATSGGGALLTITGMLGNSPTGADYEDSYLIHITSPGTFMAMTVGGAAFDTQLWLFNAAGSGVSFNDDSSGLQSTLTGAFVTGPGVYRLAISRYDNDAVDSGGGALWLDTPFGVERAPDGPGAGNPIAAWDHSGSPNAGPYTIRLTGATYGVPSPGALALTGLGMLLVGARRR